jgi:ATP-binding cassette subfamily C protein EexD
MPYDQNQTSSVDKSALYKALALSRKSFVSTAVFSFFIKFLMLAPVIYMLEVYDRVLASSSESTLLMMTLLLIFLFIVMGSLEWVRSQVMIITGSRLERILGPRVFNSVFGQTLATGGSTMTTQPLNDLLTLRHFLAGAALLTLFDAPWMPIYIAVMYLFHPTMGVVAAFSALLLIILAVLYEKTVRQDLKDAGTLNRKSSEEIQRNLRNAEVIEAMGMLPKIRERWAVKHTQMINLQTRSSKRGGLITTISKTFRTLMQSLMLGIGAYLAIQGEISGGAVIAGSLLLGRALAPIDQLINSWQSFINARDAYGRLNELLESLPEKKEVMRLPPPKGRVTFKDAMVKPVGANKALLSNITFEIEPGTTVAVIGPSAAGKSTLVRTILGLYTTESGSVRLDGAELKQWDREYLGEHIGYLPQDVELLDGTVSENIARFGEVDADKVIQAARAASIHNMILGLEEGYDTLVSANLLSAGQRQRIGLARALYGLPKLIVLDEPNSNLDVEGEQALAAAIKLLKARGSTLIIVTHRNNILEMVDKVLLLSNGQMGMYDTPAKVASMLQGMAAKQKVNIAQGQTTSKLPGQPQAQLPPQIRPQVKKVSDTEVASKVTGSKAVSNNTTGKQS